MDMYILGVSEINVICLTSVIANRTAKPVRSDHLDQRVTLYAFTVTLDGPYFFIFAPMVEYAKRMRAYY